MTHGLLSTYANGLCRCSKCRAVWSAYHRQLRRTRIALKRCVSCHRAVSTLTRCPSCNARMLAYKRKPQPSLYHASEAQ